MNRRAIPVIAVALVIGVLADLPFDAPLFPGYNALIGLGGTILLVLVAKKVLAPLVDRDESYYGDDVPPDVQHDVWAVRADVGPRDHADGTMADDGVAEDGTADGGAADGGAPDG